MRERVEPRWCGRCSAWRRAAAPLPNHLVHLLLSIVTAGLWLPVWLFVVFVDDLRCEVCGARTRRHQPATRGV